jgi:hypothetical protein
MINPTLNLEPNTFQMLYFDANEKVIDTTIFSCDSTEEHLAKIMSIRKQWYPEIEFSISSHECGVGGIGQELYLGKIRDQQPFEGAVWDNNAWNWIPPSPKPGEIEGYYWGFFPERMEWSLIELPAINRE